MRRSIVAFTGALVAIGCDRADAPRPPAPSPPASPADAEASAMKRPPPGTPIAISGLERGWFADPAAFDLAIASLDPALAACARDTGPLARSGSDKVWASVSHDGVIETRPLASSLCTGVMCPPSLGPAFVTCARKALGATRFPALAKDEPRSTFIVFTAR